MKNAIFILGCIYIFTVFLSGCGKKEAVLARIGDEEILESDFLRQMEHSPAQYKGYLATQLGKQKYLEVLINERIIIQTAIQEGLEKDPLMKRELEEMRQEYQRQLQEYQEKLLIRKFLEKHREKEIHVTDEEIERYYNTHNRMFRKPLEATISHILLESESRAQEVLEKIRKGARFSSLVQKYSLDELTRDKGGMLPPFTEGNIMPAFKDVVFELKENEISGIIRSDFGYHIIKKIDEKRLPPVPKEKAREQIKKILEKEKFGKLIEQRKKDLNVTINYDYFAKSDK